MVAPLIERSVCFEFCNKSEDYCCLKVVTRPNPIPTDMSESQFSIYWEVPRPDYVVLPPNSKVHGYFPDSVGRIELIILEENLLSKTNRAKSVSVEAANDPERVRLKRKPLCAYVSSFTQFSVFQISRFAQRVVYLKYKGRGENMKSILEPRLGAGEDSRPVHEIDFLISISYQFLFRSALFIRKLVEKVCSSWSRMDDPSVEAFPNVSQEDIQFATSSWECFWEQRELECAARTVRDYICFYLFDLIFLSSIRLSALSIYLAILSVQALHENMYFLHKDNGITDTMRNAIEDSNREYVCCIVSSSY